MKETNVSAGAKASMLRAIYRELEAIHFKSLHDVDVEALCVRMEDMAAMAKALAPEMVDMLDAAVAALRDAVAKQQEKRAAQVAEYGAQNRAGSALNAAWQAAEEAIYGPIRRARAEEEARRKAEREAESATP